MNIVLLNTSILTDFGIYEYQPRSLYDIKKLLKVADSVRSAIGHQATADILTVLLETPVEMNRINYEQKQGDVAVVFKLNSRVAEGVVLNYEQIIEIGYSFGTLVKLS